jgi:hypothetical protein
VEKWCSREIKGIDRWSAVFRLRSFGPLRAPQDDRLVYLAVKGRGLVGEEAGLGGGGDGGFAAGDADDAEDGEFAQGGARDEDAVGAGV